VGRAVTRRSSVAAVTPKKAAPTPATMKEPKSDKKQRAPSAGKIKVPVRLAMSDWRAFPTFYPASKHCFND
jgi:hypothetical protein